LTTAVISACVALLTAAVPAPAPAAAPEDEDEDEDEDEGGALGLEGLSSTTRTPPILSIKQVYVHIL
jgi:hypothetical protein